MKGITAIIFLTVSLLINSASAQDKSNRGKEFWLGYGFDYSFFNESPVNSQELALYISTELPATVTVSINGTGWTQTLNIPANTVDASILIPKSGPNDARIVTDGLASRGIHIVSNVPIAVYAHVYALMVSGATMLLPVETYGYTYYSINYTQTTSGSKLPVIRDTTENGPDWYSWFYVIAPEDNTTVQITPSDTTKNGWLPGSTHTVNLNKGETYTVFGKLDPSSTRAWAASKDMTGSKIVSVSGADGNCHPIGVFSGSGGIRLCRGDGGEFVHQQIFPAQAWGTRYLTYHMLMNTNTNINATFRNYYRVCVSDPSTVVKKNGITMTGLTNNFYYEYMDSVGGDYITSDKPIMVAQYTPNKNQCWAFNNPSYGDPEMFYLSPIEQGQKSVLLYASSHFGIDYVYCNILLPTGGVSSLLVDGAPVPAAQIKPHPNNPAYSVAIANLSNIDMQHTITSDSNLTATVYGFGFFESYGYNAGTMINNLNSIGEIKNTYSTVPGPDSFTCKTTPVRFTINVAYPLTNIHWKLSQVPGLNPNTDSIINNPVPAGNPVINGRQYHTYTLQQDFTFASPGTYYLPVTYTSPDIDNCNHTENYSIKIVVLPGPVADFSSSSATCLKDTVHFTGTSVPAPYTINSYLWNFDDGSTQNTVNASKLFTAAGPQHVRYRIYATNGCTGDTTKLINIFPSPTAVIGVSTPGCSTEPVLISDTSVVASGTIVSWHYFFGDATSAVRNTNTAFYHTYANPGTYTIKLVTVTDNGCVSDTGFKTVTINEKPLAKFGYGTGVICVRDSVYITDTSSVSTGSIQSWRYDFGDGNTLVRGTNTPFYHTYFTPGSYIISLVTISDLGCASDTFRRTVTVNDRPRADFSINALNCQKDTVYFNHINPPGSFNITSYLWNFDDGSTQATIDAKKKFPAAGLQHIRYRIFADNGCNGDTTKIITIEESPVARPGVTSSICIDSVLISDTSSIAAGSIVSWEYNFGDLTSLTRTTNTNFYHHYVLPGTYTIWLVTTSGTGCKSDTARKTVTVTAKPLSDFSISNHLVQCLRDTVYFTHITPPGIFNITGYRWDFDDGSFVTSIDAKKKFATAGLQHIRYRIFTAEGCIGDTTKQITVSPDPQAAFTAGTPVCASDSVLITDNSGISSGSIINWKYDFGDVSTLVRTNATPFYHKYSNPGSFTISLVTISDKGCISDTAHQPVVITAKPAAPFSFTGSYCAGSPVQFTSGFPLTPGSSWYWDFGDLQTFSSTTSNTVSHIYTVAQNNITVKHMVEAAGCKSDTITSLIPAIYPVPVAAFSIQKDTVCENRAVQFSSTLTGITAWQWDFGNGTGTAEPPFTRTYTRAGTYPVSLSVTGAGGCISGVSNDILVVNPQPIVNAGADKYIVGGGFAVLAASVSPAGAYTYSWTPALELNSAAVLQPTAKPSATRLYTLTATDNATHCSGSDDVLVKIIPELYIPNAFTPDGNGVNDTWGIPALSIYPNAEVIVYNRYGNIIFDRKDYYNHPWDGTWKGVKQPAGAYVYFIRLNDARQQVFQGEVIIIR